MKHQGAGHILLRFSLCALFLWFGANQLLDSASWLGYAPSWAFDLPVDAQVLVMVNGGIELVLGLLLAAGLATRIVAFILGAHLLGIAFMLGYNDVAIRDASLALAAFSLALLGPDGWCLDARYARRLPRWLVSLNG